MGRGARPGADVDLVLRDALAQCFSRADPKFRGDRFHRGLLGVVVGQHLGDHPRRTTAQLKRI